MVSRRLCTVAPVREDRMSVYQRLAELGLELPPAPKPVAAYIPWVRTGNLIYTSGQVPLVDGKPLCVGVVPTEIPPDKAQAAARLCALNTLAVLHAATDEALDRVTRVVRLGVFVASSPGFTGHAQVANGASELMVSVFGEEIGRHARSTVGCSSLPLGVPVEVEGLFEIR